MSGSPRQQSIQGTSATHGGQAFAGNVYGNVFYGNQTVNNAGSPQASGNASSSHGPADPSPSQGVINILVMSSDPRDQAHLRLGEECRELEEALSRTRLRDSFNVRSVGSCRTRDITDALDRYKPRILHFSGHGDRTGIYFERDNGQAIAVKKEAFGRLLGSQDGLDLVVLNACYSQDLAQAIADAVGHVVGMEGSILDDNAIEFTREFYRALGDGRTYDAAFERARLAVGLTSELSPHLLKRTEGATHDTLETSSSRAKPNPKQELLRMTFEGIDHYEHGRYPQAIEVYTKALDVELADKRMKAVVHYNRALSYSIQKEYLKAIEDCKKAIDIDPTHKAPRLLLAKTYGESRVWKEAVKQYKDIKAKYPEETGLDQSIQQAEMELEKSKGPQEAQGPSQSQDTEIPPLG